MRYTGIIKCVHFKLPSYEGEKQSQSGAGGGGGEVVARRWAELWAEVGVGRVVLNWSTTHTMFMCHAMLLLFVIHVRPQHAAVTQRQATVNWNNCGAGQKHKRCFHGPSWLPFLRRVGSPYHPPVQHCVNPSTCSSLNKIVIIQYIFFVTDEWLF